MPAGLIKLIRRKIRGVSVNYNKPTAYYMFFPLNYIRYLKYGRQVPLKHTATYEAMVRLKSALDEIEADVYLIQGALLGAYRNNAFAGRPKDVDLLIKSEDLKRVFRNLRFLREKGFLVEHVKVEKGIVNIQPPMGAPISFMVCDKQDGFYTRSKVDEAEIARAKIDPDIVTRKPRDDGWDDLHYGMKLDLSSDVTTLLHGTSFRIPDNTVEFLERKYGPDWRIPDNSGAWAKFSET